MHKSVALRLEQLYLIVLVKVRGQKGHQVSEVAANLVENFVESLTTFRIFELFERKTKHRFTGFCLFRCIFAINLFKQFTYHLHAHGLPRLKLSLFLFIYYLHDAFKLPHHFFVSDLPLIIFLLFREEGEQTTRLQASRLAIADVEGLERQLGKDRSVIFQLIFVVPS